MIAARYVPDVPPKRRIPKTRAARKYAPAHPERVPDGHAARVCAWCKATLDRRQARMAAGWEPTRDGWRCGKCAGPRRQLVSESARKLITAADQPWKLALVNPMHARYELCLPCEVAGAAKSMLLAQGALTAPEAAIVRDGLRGPLAGKRCGQDQLDVLMAIDPDRVQLQAWQPARAR